MLCEKCNLQNATVHLKHTINGESKDTYLCASCAGESERGISVGNLFQGFIESFFGQQANFSYEKKTQAPEKPPIKCRACGLTYDSLKKSSKLGCANCYATFKTELDYIIRNIQGASTHEGKFPKRGGQTFIAKREIEQLRAQLKKAIEDEEFETAAQIRDEIKKRIADEEGENG
jgi:protein arginine kinase activator